MAVGKREWVEHTLLTAAFPHSDASSGTSHDHMPSSALAKAATGAATQPSCCSRSSNATQLQEHAHFTSDSSPSSSRASLSPAPAFAPEVGASCVWVGMEGVGVVGSIWLKDSLREDAIHTVKVNGCQFCARQHVPGSVKVIWRSLQPLNSHVCHGHACSGLDCFSRPAMAGTPSGPAGYVFCHSGRWYSHADPKHVATCMPSKVGVSNLASNFTS